MRHALLTTAMCIAGGTAQAAVFQYTATSPEQMDFRLTVTAPDELVATGSLFGTLKCNPSTGCTTVGSWNAVTLDPFDNTAFAIGSIGLTFDGGRVTSGSVFADSGIDGHDYTITGSAVNWLVGNGGFSATDGQWVRLTSFGHDPSDVPEPMSLMLLGTGLLGFCFVRKWI